MLVDDIALTLLPQVGPKAAAHLLAHFGTAEAVFGASKEELIETAELKPEFAAHIAARETHRRAEKELEYCNANGITVIPSTSSLYPALLRECNDYPHVIYYIGNTDALNGRLLSIVGTRRMTPYGQRVCNDIVAGIGEMFPDAVIVSGLAFGVDSTAHRAALAAGVATVGVSPDPLPGIYPTAHERLAAEMISKGGGVLSEYHSGTKLKGTNFVPRNRIIAGMSAGTLVVESPARGGSLITAGMADGYHRSVMAVPGRVGDTCSEGTNYLIVNNRARMVCTAGDIAREMMWDIPEKAVTSATREMTTLSPAARRLLGHIGDGEAVSIDSIAAVSGLSMAELAPLIFELEFERVIRVLPGKMYEKA